MSDNADSVNCGSYGSVVLQPCPVSSIKRLFGRITRSSHVMIDEVGPAHQSPNQKIPITDSLPSIREPFIGLAGHCFLKLGMWMDHISFRRPTQFPPSTRVSAERKLAEAGRFSLRNKTHSWLGTGSCVVAADGLTAVSNFSCSHQLKSGEKGA
jgi:hypothetical protein